MKYKDKYFKYKAKYLNLKQLDRGKNSYQELDPRILENISTGESPDERIIRVARRELPPNGYKIMENSDEILTYNYNIESSSPDRVQFIDQVKRNIDDVFRYAFDIIQLFGSKLFYIDARGDGNCFLNCLYMHTFISKKQDLIYRLYSLTGILKSKLINFNNFKKLLEFLGDTLLDSKISEFGEEIVNMMKSDVRNPNIPDVQTLGQVYADFFNVRIIVIQVDDNYKFLAVTAQINPDDMYINGQTDYVVIIQKSNIHFGLLVPIIPEALIDVSLDIKKHLFDLFYDKYKR